MRYAATLLLAIICSLAIVSCSSDPTGTTATPNGSISAKIAGAGWSATTVQSSWQSNVLSLGGSQIQGADNHQINITGLISTTGTYQLNPFAGLNASYTEATSQGGLSAKIFSVTSGTLVVTTLSSTGASGTFAFEAKESQGTATRSITEGKFDVKF